MCNNSLKSFIIYGDAEVATFSMTKRDEMLILEDISYNHAYYIAFTGWGFFLSAFNLY